MPFATSPDGLRIRYAESGAGPPIILITHVGASALGWHREFIELLSRDFRVIVFDNRGTGESDKPLGPFTVLDMAKDALAVLGHLGISRAHVLGLSMGGLVAQELTLHAPERVDKLILVSTLAGWANATPTRARASEALAAGADPALTPREAARKWLPAYYSAAYLSEHEADVLEQMARMMARTSPRTLELQGEAIGIFDTYGRLAEIRRPVLVIHGNADDMVPIENGRVLAERIPAARMAIVQGAGHIPTTEQPQVVATLVRNFAGVPGKTAGSTA